jgi:hypothetical protein
MLHTSMGQEKPNSFVEIIVDDVEPRWSSVDYGRNFLSAKEAYWGERRTAPHRIENLK